MRTNRIVILGAIVALLLVSRSSTAGVPEDAESKFRAGEFEQTFNLLLGFRKANAGTLRVDFMLGVSGCHLAGARRTGGAYLLSHLSDWYKPLSAGNRAVVSAQLAQCAAPAVAANEEPFAGVDLKGDAGNNQLIASHANDSNGAPLASIQPPATPPGMTPLSDGVAYLQGDYRSALVPTAYSCAERCAQEARCVAMTYIPGSQTCWLKDHIPAKKAAAGYISAAKQKALVDQAKMNAAKQMH